MAIFSDLFVAKTQAETATYSYHHRWRALCDLNVKVKEIGSVPPPVVSSYFNCEMSLLNDDDLMNAAGSVLECRHV